MSDLIHVNELIGKLLNTQFKDEEDQDICYSVIRSISTIDEIYDEENLNLRRELDEALKAVEHNHNLVEQERLRQGLYRKDGEISGLRFALQCITKGLSYKAVLDEEER